MGDENLLFEETILTHIDEGDLFITLSETIKVVRDRMEIDSKDFHTLQGVENKLNYLHENYKVVREKDQTEEDIQSLLPDGYGLDNLKNDLCDIYGYGEDDFEPYEKFIELWNDLDKKQKSEIIKYNK